MFSPGRGSGRPGEVRVTVSCGGQFMISDPTDCTKLNYLILKNCRVKHKLHRVHRSSCKTGDIVLCPSTGEIRVLTLRLTRALVLHHTPSTKRVGVTCTTGTVCMLVTLFYGYLEHLRNGGAINEWGRHTCKH